MTIPGVDALVMAGDSLWGVTNGRTWQPADDHAITDRVAFLCSSLMCWKHTPIVKHDDNRRLRFTA